MALRYILRYTRGLDSSTHRICHARQSKERGTQEYVNARESERDKKGKGWGEWRAQQHAPGKSWSRPRTSRGNHCACERGCCCTRRSCPRWRKPAQGNGLTHMVRARATRLPQGRAEARNAPLYVGQPLVIASGHCLWYVPLLVGCCTLRARGPLCGRVCHPHSASASPRPRCAYVLRPSERIVNVIVTRTVLFLSKHSRW